MVIGNESNNDCMAASTNTSLADTTFDPSNFVELLSAQGQEPYCSMGALLVDATNKEFNDSPNKLLVRYFMI